MTDVKLDDLKQLLIENCMLRVSADEIKPDMALFGPGSLGLDSLDALQITVAIERNYGIAIQDSDTARQAFQSLSHLQNWLRLEVEKTSKAA
jgi:acyl carrier protein